MFSFQNLKENIKDKLCWWVEFRLYVNNECVAEAYQYTKVFFVYKHNNKSHLILLDQYPQKTVERWLKDHLCNEDVDDVMIYKKRYHIFS